MKSALLVVLLAAAASAGVVSNDVPDALELLEVADGGEMADVDLNEKPEVIVIDADELFDAADLTDGVEETAVATRRNLNEGYIFPGDTLAYNGEVRANGVAGHIHIRDIRVTTNWRVWAIRVNRVGASQNATPSIIEGGIGRSLVTIRIRSAVGRGYHYSIQVYVGY